MSIELGIAGLVVGLLIGATGIGGGVIMAPILLLLGIQPSLVVGTDLFYGFITKLFGVAQHYRQGSVNVRWVLALGSGSLIGALFGVFLIRHLFNHYGAVSANLFMKKALATVLIFASILLLIGEIFSNRLKDKLRIFQIDDPGIRRVLIASFGSVIGFTVGMTSIGSGSVIALFLIFFSNMKTKEIVGTEIAHAVLLSGVATIGHLGLGTVDLKLAFNLLIGSLPGVIIGSYLTTLVPSRPLKMGIASLIIISAIKSLT
jgi:hypothetical protein